MSSYFEEGIELPYDGTPTTSTPLGNASSSAKASAISSKITKLLSSSFADSGIRDALAILDARGVTNSAETRRNLRQDAQKEVIDCNAEIVADFGKVAEQLKRVGTMIATLNKTCDEMRKHIVLAKQETQAMLEEAAILMAAKKESEAKQDILHAFNKHFVISDKDLSALTSSIEPVDDHFFTVLARVKKIREDCEVLLGSEHHSLGMELMEQTSRDLDAAFKKLYQWIQREFKTLDLEDPHISGSIRRALRVLAERPSLFQNCLDFFAEAREHTLSDAFRLALTGPIGGSDGADSAKPIEFSTHDLLRYLGDMLAWVHSSSVSEKESLEGLFISDSGEIAKGMKAGKDSEPWTRLRSEEKEVQNGGEPVFDGPKALNDLVNRNLTGICHTLRQRIEVAVRNNDDPVLVYRALYLLKFYRDIFSKLLGPGSGLAETVTGLETTVFDHFEHILQDEVDNNDVDQLPPSDLSVPTVLTTALDRLGVLLKLTTGASAVSEVDRLLSVALTPFLATCEEMAEDIPNPLQRTVFRLNQGLKIRSSPYIAPEMAETSTIMQGVAAGARVLTGELVDLQHEFLVRESGLHILLESSLFSDQATSRKAEEEAKGDNITIETLQDVAAKLDVFLPNAQMDALENLKDLIDKNAAKEITEAAIQRFCKDFEQLEQAIEDHDEAIDRAASVAEDEQVDVIEEGHDSERDERRSTRFGPYFPRTSTEIRVLLS